MERGSLQRWAQESLLTLTSCWLLRGRLYAAWLAAHGLLAVLPVTSRGRLDWPPFNSWVIPLEGNVGEDTPTIIWVSPLEANVEVTPINTYTIVLWSIVAALALAQAVRPANGRGGMWLVGWICTGGIAAMIAVEEYLERKGYLAQGVEWLEFIPSNVRWEFVVAPFVAVPGVMAGYVIYKSVTRNPALAMLSVAAIVFAVTGLARELISGNLWMDLMEEGSEMMAGSIITVILFELLVQYYTEVKHEDLRIGSKAGLWRRWRGQA
ncbi:MAG: hypothetical protein OXG43_12175 [Chloroflexi bacterium]|nr:hypothetical protein [Chloroflexota bacterium]